MLYVTLEYLPNGDLRNHLRASRPDTESEPSLTSDQLIKFALDVAMGMEHLASSAVYIIRMLLLRIKMAQKNKIIFVFYSG